MALKSFIITCTFLITLNAVAQQNPAQQLKNTTWIQEGYERCLKIGDSTYTYYNVNNMDCKVLADGPLSGRFKIVSLSKNRLVLNPGGIVNYTFKKTGALPSVCAKTTSKAASYEENFKIFWETFHSNYAFFKERNINWEQIYNEYLPKVKEVKSPKGLADILSEVTKKLGDGHIRLEIPDSLKTKVTATTSPAIKRTKDKVTKDIQNKYLAEINAYNNGVISWGKLKASNTGYIVINDMNNFSDYVPLSANNPSGFLESYTKIKESKQPFVQFEDEHQGVEKTMKKVLSDLGQSEAIVIDLRFNGGGLETVALKLLSYFINETKTVLAVKAKTLHGYTANQEYVLRPSNTNYKGKIYLLLSANTASAAEIFALSALSYPHITTIGTRTAGIFSEMLWKELPNGWEFSLSNEVYMDTKGQTYEGRGIPVNHELNYPRNRLDFYNSFYNGEEFHDTALDKIISGALH